MRKIGKHIKCCKVNWIGLRYLSMEIIGEVSKELDKV